MSSSRVTQCRSAIRNKESPATTVYVPGAAGAAVVAGVVAAAVVSVAGAAVVVGDALAVTSVVEVVDASPSSPPHALANVAASAHATTAVLRGVGLIAHPQVSSAVLHTVEPACRARGAPRANTSVRNLN
jgi:hypothetical protein